MRFRYLTLLLCVFCLAISCNSDKSLTYILGDLKDCPQVRDIEIIKLSNKIPLSTILKVEFCNDSFYIQTETGLYRFSKDGEFISEISCRGRGPNEWLRLNTFFISEDKTSIYILDSNTCKIMSFTMDGEYIETIKLDETTMSKNQVCNALIYDGKIIFNNMVYNDLGNIYSYMDFASGDKNIYELYSVPYKTNNGAVPIGRHPMSTYDGTYRCIVPFKNEIYEIVDNKLVVSEKIPTDKKIVKDSNLGDIKDYSLMTYLDFTKQGMFSGYDGIFETSKWIILSYFNIERTYIDKLTNKVYIQSIDESPDVDNIPLLNLIGTINDKLIGTIERWRIEQYSKNIKDTTNPILEKIKDFADQYNYTDNPCLIIYNIM